MMKVLVLRVRQLCLRIARELGVLSLVVKAALTLEIRRRAWSKGFRIRTGNDGSITIAKPGVCGNCPSAVRLSSGHRPYVLDVIDHFDYYHGCVEPALADGAQLVDYSAARLHVLRPSGDAFRFTGFAEPEETTRVYLEHAKLKEGDLVLDLGAYCGASTIAFARAVGSTGHVVAFEPDPNNAAALRENVERFGLSNVSLLEMGVWKETTRLGFAAEGNMGSAIASVLERATATKEIAVVSLAEAVDRAQGLSGIERVAFIKMDIEGAEVPVLESACELLSLHEARLAIEPHRTSETTPPGSLNTDIVMQSLVRAGYVCSLADQGVGSHPLVLASRAGR